MIKILKHGALRFLFICPVCRCEFTTNGDELDNNGQIKCPECSNILHADKEVVEELREERNHVD